MSNHNFDEAAETEAARRSLKDADKHRASYSLSPFTPDEREMYEMGWLAAKRDATVHTIDDPREELAELKNTDQ